MTSTLVVAAGFVEIDCFSLSRTLMRMIRHQLMLNCLLRHEGRRPIAITSSMTVDSCFRSWFLPIDWL